MKRIKKENLIYLIFLLAIAFIASLPAFRGGVYQGHDLQFHLGRIQAISEELSAGQFPVRYESNAWYGHGYISTLFYGNIFLYIPAGLFLLGLPIWRCYNVYVLLVNLVTVFVAAYSFKGLFNSEKWGLLATGIYTLSGYRLSNLYVRTALGEYTAMIFLPLVVYGVYRIYKTQDTKCEIRDCMPLIIAATGLIQSHILTTELVSMFIFIFAVINIRTTINRIKPLLMSLVFILGLNAFFIVPFLDGYSSMELYINNDLSQNSIRGDGLYLSQVFGLITKGRGSSSMWSTENEAYLNIGVAILLCLVVAIIGIIVSYKKANRDNWKMALTLLVFGLLSAWMSTIYFPWDSFAGDGALDKLMSSVQYPWRYVMIETLCFVIVGTYGFKMLLEKYYYIVLAIMSCITIACAGAFFYTLSWGNVTINSPVANENWADKLYLPVGTDRELLSDTEVIIDGDKITLPVLAYENVRVYDTEDNELEWTVGANNCIRVNYSDNHELMKVRFVEPISWRISEIVSLGFIIVLVVTNIKKAKTQ